MAFYEFEDNLEMFVAYIVQAVLENCEIELKTLERDTGKLEKIKAPFPRITYDDALKFLHEKGFC